MRTYRFYLKSRLGTREVFPVGVKNLLLDYSKNSNRSEWIKSLKGKMTFGGEDFNWLYAIELTIYRCEFIELIIKKKYLTEYRDFLRQNISLNSADVWDRDKCLVSLSVTEETKYECFEAGKDKEVNVFSFLTHDRTSNPISGELEFHTVDGSEEEGVPFDMFPGEPNPYSKGWRIKDYSRLTNLPLTLVDYSVTWVRETKVSVLAPQGFWILDGAVYARPVVLYNKIDTIGYDTANPDNVAYSYTVLETELHNGVGLGKLLEFLIQYSCPDLTLKSDFFQFNPDILTNINYATGNPSKVRNLVMYQKSDVKRPNDDDATQFNTTLEKTLKDICNIFQLEYEITDDNIFRIEHVSFKNRVLGLDITQAGRSELNFGKNKYKYDNDKIPRMQTFTFMDASGGDFEGLPIQYAGACVGRSETKEEAVVVENISTDIEYILNNPDPDGKVSDEGFVLVANDDEDGILTDPQILGGNSLNNTLAWSRLHIDYWRYNRAQRTMTMNSAKTTALTVIPTKLQENLVTIICCDDDFNPDELIKTGLGENGILKSAQYDLFQEKLKFSVLFPSDDNLVNNSKPIGVEDEATTDKNTVVIIDVLSNDTDPDGNIDSSTLEIILAPTNGVAVVTVDFKIQYTPNTDFVGSDFIVYSVKDNWSEPMLNTLVSISIIEP